MSDFADLAAHDESSVSSQCRPAVGIPITIVSVAGVDFTNGNHPGVRLSRAATERERASGSKLSVAARAGGKPARRPRKKIDTARRATRTTLAVLRQALEAAGVGMQRHARRSRAPRPGLAPTNQLISCIQGPVSVLARHRKGPKERALQYRTQYL